MVAGRPEELKQKNVEINNYLKICTMFRLRNKLLANNIWIEYGIMQKALPGYNHLIINSIKNIVASCLSPHLLQHLTY